MKIEPHYEPAHVLLARLYLQDNQPNRTVTEAEAALRINPDDETALYQEMMARLRLGQTADVQSLVQRLKAVHQRSAEQQQQKKGYVLRDEVQQ